MPDDALIDGLKETILDEIEPDWVTLAADPHRVADVIARRIAPLIGESAEADEIRGRPWSSR
jgi:hypothetical protein